MKKNILLSVILLCSLAACNTGTSNTENRDKEKVSASAVKHAEYFDIEDLGSYKKVTVYDPWHEGNILSEYYLVRDNEKSGLPENARTINIPLKGIALNSCSHVAFIDMIGETDKVAGMSSSKYVYNGNLRQRLKDGSCKDIGDSFAINFESTAMLGVPAIMVTKYENSDPNVERLANSGMDIIYNVEWMEPDILGRAEWIKFVAAFFCKDSLANALFTQVENRYDSLCRITGDVVNRPDILPGMPFKGTWYVPSGNSFMGRLFKAAGGNYKYSGTSDKGSLPLSFETMLKDFADCDIWIGTDALDLNEIKVRDNRLASFKAYRQGNVYNQCKRRTESGGNDFWETGIARPDLLLQDLIIILHPELIPDAETFFMEKLQ